MTVAALEYDPLRDKSYQRRLAESNRCNVPLPSSSLVRGAA